MKLSITFVLAAFFSAASLAAFTFTPPSPPERHRPAGAPVRPDVPTSPVDHGPGSGRNTPKQLKSGEYVKPTPVAIERKVAVIADLELSIVPGDSNYTLHVISSLPVRNLVATNQDSGVELAAVKLDDAVDFKVRVDGQPNTATTLKLQLNTGIFKGKARIRTAVFDLLENVGPAAEPLQGIPGKVENKASDDEALPAPDSSKAEAVTE